MPKSSRDPIMALNNYHRGSALNTRGRVYFDLGMCVPLPPITVPPGTLLPRW
jgi:hypothetical protein